MQHVTKTLQERHLTQRRKISNRIKCRVVTLYIKRYELFVSLTFVFQPESSCRHANIREEVEVELVGGAVEESRDRGALKKINSRV